MRRRNFIKLVAGATAIWPLGAHAQQRVFRIGLLGAGVGIYPTFDEAFRKLGWIEGKNFVYEKRFANNRLEQLPSLTAELVRQNVDLIVTAGTLASLAA
jgi:hypothetical protein